MNTLTSRRDFCRNALVASSLVAVGLPSRALGMEHGAGSNVRISHDGRDDHYEPCLAVNPRDPSNLLAVCQLEIGAPRTYSSFDGGRTWQGNGPLSLPAGVVGAGNNTIAFDGAGRGFVCSLLAALPSAGAAKGATFTIVVWRTEDGGRTFSSPVTLNGAGPGPLDHPWLVASRRSPHVVHVVWTAGTNPRLNTTLNYTRSTDGGQTFEVPRTLATDRRGLNDAMVALGPPDNVYVIFHKSPPPGEAAARRLESPATVMVLRSEDGGRTFDKPIDLGLTTFGIAFPGTDNNTLPTIAADPGSGLVCAAFSRHELRSPHAAVLLAASRNGGRTWPQAAAVTPQDQSIYFEPQLAIDTAGRIGVLAFAMTHGKVRTVLMLSEPDSPRFCPPITITDKPFNPRNSGFGRRWFLGDYQALATTPGAFHPLWNDTRTGHLQLFTTTVPVSGA